MRRRSGLGRLSTLSRFCRPLKVNLKGLDDGWNVKKRGVAGRSCKGSILASVSGNADPPLTKVYKSYLWEGKVFSLIDI